MKKELSDSLALQIATSHEQAEQAQTKALAEVSSLIELRTQTAEFVATAKASSGKWFRQWWVDSNLPDSWAARYLRINKTAQRNKLGDKNQLQLIGLLPKPEGSTRGTGTAKPANPFQWINHCGKLKKAFAAIDIGSMDTFEKKSAAEQLKPIVEYYERLTQG